MSEAINPYLLGDTRYRVVAPCVVARLTGGQERYIHRGAVLPPSTLPSHIEHMLASGLIVKVDAR